MPLVVPYMGMANLTVKDMGTTPQNFKLNMTSNPLTGYLSLPTTWRPFDMPKIHHVRDIVSSLTKNSTLQICKYAWPKPFSRSNSTIPSDNNTGTMQHISDLAIPFFTVLLILLFVTALVGLALKAPDWINIHSHTRNAMPVLTIRDFPRRHSRRINPTRISSLVSTSRGSTGRHRHFGDDVDIEAARAMARVRDLIHDDDDSYASYASYDYDSDAPMARGSLVPVLNYGAIDRPGQEFWRYAGWDGMAS